MPNNYDIPDELNDFIASYSDPDLFAKQNKRMAIGELLAAALGSLSGHEETYPMAKGVTDQIREQQKYQRSLAHQAYVDQLNMLETKARMRQYEMDEAERLRREEQEKRVLDSRMALGEQIRKQQFDTEAMKMESENKKRETDLKTLDKFLGMYQKYGEILGDVPFFGGLMKPAVKIGEELGKKVSGATGEKIRKVKEEEIPQVQEQGKTVQMGIEAGFEPSAMLGAFGKEMPLTPSQQKAEAWTKEERGFLKEQRQYILDDLKFTAETRQDPRYPNEVTKYSQMLVGGTIKLEEVPEEYRRHAQALANIDAREQKMERERMYAGKTGAGQGQEMKVYKSWLDFMGDSKISANDKQDFLSIPTERFRMGDESGMSFFLQSYAKQSPQFIRETLERAFNDASRPMTEAGASADLRMQGLIYAKMDGQVYDQQGQSYGTLDSVMFSRGYTRDTDIKGNPVYVPQPNTLRDTYEANPDQFIQYYQKGAGGTPIPPESKKPKTPYEERKVTIEKEKQTKSAKPFIEMASTAIITDIFSAYKINQGLFKPFAGGKESVEAMNEARRQVFDKKELLRLHGDTIAGLAKDLGISEEEALNKIIEYMKKSYGYLKR